MVSPLLRWYRRQRARWFHRCGLTRRRQGDAGRAIAAFNRALRHHPRPAVVYTERGLAHWQLSMAEAALADYNRAIALDAAATKAYSNRGLVRYEEGDVEGALQDWETVLRYRPGDAAATYNRGLYRASVGHHREAKVDFDQVLQVCPNLATAYFHRGNVRAALGDMAGAVEDWELALCNDLTLEPAQERLLQARRHQADAVLTQVLQQPFAATPFRFTVESQGDRLLIQVHRPQGTPINYRTLAADIRAALIPLELAPVQRFRVVSRMGEATRPDWDQVYGLYDGQPCPPSRWRQALATTLLLFPPFGVLALVYASQVKGLHRQGRYPAALRASETVGRLFVQSRRLLVGTVAVGLCLIGVATLIPPVEGYTPTTRSFTDRLESRWPDNQ